MAVCGDSKIRMKKVVKFLEDRLDFGVLGSVPLFNAVVSCVCGGFEAAGKSSLHGEGLL